MKKLVFMFLIFFSMGLNVCAEGIPVVTEAIPVNNMMVLIAAAVLIVGIIIVSAFNGYAYNKKNIRQMMSQYRGQSRQGKGYSRSNYRRNYGTSDNSHQMQDEFNRQTQQQMQDEFNRQAMEESIKAVTPFDHGGYVQGAGFNPSDTAAQQMNDMNNMNMGMF